MKLIAQIVIAVLIALFVKDRIDILLINYEIKTELEKRMNQQEKAKNLLRKQNAPESNINWSGSEAGSNGAEATVDALDRLIEKTTD